MDSHKTDPSNATSSGNLMVATIPCSLTLEALIVGNPDTLAQHS
jgi:hypothetical protein